MRIPISKTVDAATLADQMKSTLGIDVGVTVVNTSVDGNGAPVQGLVILIDAATGAEVPDQDPVKVAAVISAHVVPPPPVTPHKALANALGSANNLGDVKTALMAFAGAVAAHEDSSRNRRPDKPLKGKG